MIKFLCKHCGQKLGVPDQWTGHDVRCPRCKAALPVPAETEPQFQAKPAAAQPPPTRAVVPQVAKAAPAQRPVAAQLKAKPATVPGQTEKKEPATAPPAVRTGATASSHTLPRSTGGGIKKSAQPASASSPTSPATIARRPAAPLTPAAPAEAPVRSAPPPNRPTPEPLVAKAPPADYSVFAGGAYKSAPQVAGPAAPAPGPTIDALATAAAPQAPPQPTLEATPGPSLSEIVRELHAPEEPPVTATKAVADLMQGLATQPPPTTAEKKTRIKLRRTRSKLPEGAPRALGALALFAGIAALALCAVPALTKFVLPLGILGLLLSLFALVLRTEPVAMVMSLGGGSICTVAVALAILVSCGVLPGATPHSLGNARGLVARGQDVQVRITSASIVRPAVRGSQWKTVKTADQRYLQLMLEIKPITHRSDIDYRSWGRLHDGLDSPTLIDNEGNPLKLVEVWPLMPASRPPEPSHVAAQKGIVDVLLFEIPPTSAQELQLQLPEANVGGGGTLEFKIPAAMLRKS